MQAVLSSTDPYVTIAKATASFGSVTRGGTVNNSADAFIVTVSPTCPETHTIAFALDVTAQGPYSYTRTCLIHATVAVRQLAYDDGAADFGLGYGAAGGGLAVRLTPDTYPCYLTYARLWPRNSCTTTLYVWDDHGPNGTPGSVLGTKPVTLSAADTWTDIDISSLNITITSGSIYLGWVDDAVTYYSGLDTDPPYYNRSWAYTGSLWMQIETAAFLGNMMVRARYSNSLPLHINPPYDYTWCATQPASGCLATSDGTAPFSWSVIAGALPPGVDLNSNTGCLTGSPTAGGTFTATIRVTDSSSTAKEGLQEFTFNVGDVPTAPSEPNPADGATDIPGDVILSWGGPAGMYSEDFNDGLAQDWQPTSPDQWQVVSGEYRANPGAASSLTTSTYAGQTWTDLSAQATMRCINMTDGTTMFVVARATPDFVADASGSAYVVGITWDGHYNVFAQISGSTVGLQPWTTSPLLHTGDQPNAIQLSLDGSTVKALINGSLAWSGSDSAIPGPGRVGLVAFGPGGGTAAGFDDVIVDEPVAFSGVLSDDQQWYNAYPIAGGTPYQAPAVPESAAHPALADENPNAQPDPPSATGSTTYDVYLGPDCDHLSLVASGLGQRSFDPPADLGENVTYCWKVVARSACGNTDGPCWSFTTAVDAAPPVITHTPLTDTGDLGPYTVCATVTDDFGVDAVTLYWSKNGGAFTSVAMMPSGAANQYCADIPGPSATGDHYCYYIEATDASAAHNTATSPAAGENCFSINSCIADTMPGTGYTSSGAGYSRGNVFLCTSQRSITNIEHYLTPTASTEMRFFVYESPALSGTYAKIHENVVPSSGTGAGWDSSGPISVQLIPGKVRHHRHCVAGRLHLRVRILRTPGFYCVRHVSGRLSRIPLPAARHPNVFVVHQRLSSENNHVHSWASALVDSAERRRIV